MVYRGKPSTGCQTCRSRHIKCDETRPHCKACLRTGRQCPGYPHPLDIMLRDRIAFTRKKGSKSPTTVPSVASNKKETIQAPEPTIITPVQSPPRKSLVSFTPPTPPITNSLHMPLEDTVTSLFFNSYLYLPKDRLVRIGFMDLLPESYSASLPDSSVRLSTLAVAFFSVAAWTGQQALLDSSRQCFVKALSRTREALQGDVDQNLDDILMTVLLLSTYEEFNAMKEQKLPPKAHLRGAVALINNCNPERQESYRSRTLANAVQTQIIKTSIGAAFPMIETPEIWPLALPIPQLVSSQLTVTTTEVVNLRLRWARLSAGIDTPNLDEVASILSQAYYLDNQLDAWCSGLPTHWIPGPATDVPQSVRDAGMYHGRCDCYSDFWVAATWNSYRDSRIVLHTIILGCLQLHPERGDDIRTTLMIIHALAVDICATVPFYLGSQTHSVQMNTSGVEFPRAATISTSIAHQQTGPLLGGWFIMTPLHNLKAMGCLPEEMVNWVDGQMQRVLQIYTFGR